MNFIASSAIGAGVKVDFLHDPFFALYVRACINLESALPLLDYAGSQIAETGHKKAPPFD
jgi:hypothetical protein